MRLSRGICALERVRGGEDRRASPCAPRRVPVVASRHAVGVVEQVPVLEGEGQAGLGRDALAVDRQALLTALLQPLQSCCDGDAGSDPWSTHRLEHDRAAADFGQSSRNGRASFFGSQLASVSSWKPSPRSPSTFAPFRGRSRRASRRCSSASRQSRAAPTKVRSGFRRCADHPQAPASIASLQQTGRIMRCSSSVGMRPVFDSSMPIT